MSAGSGRVLFFASLLVSSTLAASCGGADRAAHPLAPDRSPSGDTVTGKAADPADIGAGHVDGPPLPPLADRPGVYDPADTGPVDISVTVTDEQAFAAVKADVAGARAPVRFEAAGYDAGDAVTNATIELRGSTSRSAPQKSYQIKLAAGAAPWRGSRTLNLLKHPLDLTRVRNALSFELFRRITGFTSLRTGFVHLFVDTVDQGLYEWVEEPDEQFLAARGLNVGGALYKAKNFPFAPIDNQTASDPGKVAALVAAKARPDLAKLRRMLAAVNDAKQPIDDVVAHYFNRENYLTWLAVNVLLADYDSTHQNFMLYSPPGFEGWYFLPWDYDGAWEWNAQPGAPRLPRAREGVANWWSVVLHRRFLSEPHNLADLTARVSELASTTITDAESARILDRHHDLVKTFIGAPPDLDGLPCDGAGTAEAIRSWEAEYARIAASPGHSRDQFVATLDRPMPYWLYFPVNPSTASVTFTWSPSFQLRGAAISYDIDVGTSADFEPAAVLVGAKDLSEQMFTTPLPSGHYFWRVVARAATESEQRLAAVGQRPPVRRRALKARRLSACRWTRAASCPACRACRPSPGRRAVGRSGSRPSEPAPRRASPSHRVSVRPVAGHRRRPVLRTHRHDRLAGRGIHRRRHPLRRRDRARTRPPAAPRSTTGTTAWTAAAWTAAAKSPARSTAGATAARATAARATAAGTTTRATTRTTEAGTTTRTTEAGTTTRTTAAGTTAAGTAPRTAAAGTPTRTAAEAWRTRSRPRPPPGRSGPPGARVTIQPGPPVSCPDRRHDHDRSGVRQRRRVRDRRPGPVRGDRRAAGPYHPVDLRVRPPASAAIAAASTALIATAAIPTIATAKAATRFRAGKQINEVIKVALFLGARRRLLAGHHPHEPHVVGAPAHHLERLHQAGQAIALDAHLLFDLGCRTYGALVHRRGLASAALAFGGRRRFGIGRLGGRFSLGGDRLVRLGRRTGRPIFAGRLCGRRFRRCFRRCFRRSFFWRFRGLFRRDLPGRIGGRFRPTPRPFRSLGVPPSRRPPVRRPARGLRLAPASRRPLPLLLPLPWRAQEADDGPDESVPPRAGRYRRTR